MNTTTLYGLSRFALLSLCVALVTIGRSDDWRMYRKDAQHTAASSDKINLPMKEAWVWKSARVGGVAPLSTAVVAGDRVYFCGGQNESGKTKRQLLAVDTATGKIVWKSDLIGSRVHRFLSEDVGPAVTSDDNVFVFDLTPVGCPSINPVVVSAYDKTGNLIDQRRMPNRDGLSRLFLRTGHDQDVDFVLRGNSKPDG